MTDCSLDFSLKTLKTSDVTGVSVCQSGKEVESKIFQLFHERCVSVSAWKSVIAGRG